MADIANTVATFLTLATTWYKNATARNTASATLKHHLTTFFQYQVHVSDPIESLFQLNRRHRQNPLLIYQAARVLNLQANLLEWLTEAGFRPVRFDTVIVRRRDYYPASPWRYFVTRRRSRQGQLVLPTFGVTGKEVAFLALFEKLKEAYEKLEAVYPQDAYRYIRPVCL